MTRLGSVLVMAVAAAGMACMGHGSQGAAQSRSQSQPAQAQGQTAPRAGGTAMMDVCPMAVPGAQVTAADTEGGESITFTTTSPDSVQELRRRVRALAAMHDHHAGDQAGMQGMHGDMGSMHGDMGGMHGDMGSMHGDMAGTGDAGAAAPEGSAGSGDAGAGEAQGGGMHGMEGMQGMRRMPPSRAVVEDVDGGARVTVTAENPADADQLRSAIRAHVDRMQQSGSCGMGMGQGMQHHGMMHHPSQQQ